jgi:hypothetical protein
MSADERIPTALANNDSIGALVIRADRHAPWRAPLSR